MSYVKDMYMAAHKDLIEEYLIHHPECSYDQAYHDCSDAAYNLMREKLEDAGEEYYSCRLCENGLDREEIDNGVMICSDCVERESLAPKEDPNER